MNRAQDELAATCSKGPGGGFNIAGYNINSTVVWIIVVFVIFCCCSGSFSGIGGYSGKGGKCCKGGRTGFLGSYWVIILVVILCACSGAGLGGGGLLGNAGNVNTNVINVQSNDDYADDDGGIF